MGLGLGLGPRLGLGLGLGESRTLTWQSTMSLPSEYQSTEALYGSLAFISGAMYLARLRVRVRVRVRVRALSHPPTGIARLWLARTSPSSA